MDPIEILYKDKALVVCRKPAGFLSEQGPGKNLPDAVRETLCAAGEDGTVFTVHRLDKPVAGLTVLARTHKAASSLIAQIAAHTVEKEYLAVLRGVLEENEGLWEDLLFHDSRTNKTFVVTRPRKGVREAKLSWRLLGTAEAEGQSLSLVRIRLYTGRTHQIRAQFSARGLPLYGDVRYGSRNEGSGPALWSARLDFTHPDTGRPLRFFLRPPEQTPWALFPAACYTAASPFPAEEK